MFKSCVVCCRIDEIDQSQLTDARESSKLGRIDQLTYARRQGYVNLLRNADQSALRRESSNFRQVQDSRSHAVELAAFPWFHACFDWSAGEARKTREDTMLPGCFVFRVTVSGGLDSYKPSSRVGLRSGLLADSEGVVVAHRAAELTRFEVVYNTH